MVIFPGQQIAHRFQGELQAAADDDLVNIAFYPAQPIAIL
jgi:hypothetical protein